MPRLRTLLFSLLWLVPFVPAAAQQREGYPSLLPRPVESRDRDAEAAAAKAATAQPPATADAALVARLATLTAQAQAAGDAFDRAHDDAMRAATAARGAAVGSEAWVSAEQWISALDSNRYDAIGALATLDMLYAERAAADMVEANGGDIAAIASARAPILSMVDRQNDRLDSLNAMLRRP